MAERKCFIAKTEGPYWEEKLVTFHYYPGFSLSQAQKSIRSLHESILKTDDRLRVLEISTKSTEVLGTKLSAFHLRYPADGQDYAIENVFQSSKVFTNGGPYLDLLHVHPKEAKTDERLKTSGALVCFRQNGRDWPLIPQTMFYDWIYIWALYHDKELSKKILDYNTFTDIVFNHKKSINCQARAAAIFVSLSLRGEIDSVIKEPRLFETVYRTR